MKSPKKIVRASLRATEKLVSKIGGKKTAASGAWLEKADGRVPGLFRIETKFPPTGQYRLYKKEWDKLWKIAVLANEVAVFHIKLSADVEIAVMRDTDYRAMCGGKNKAVSTFRTTDNSWSIERDEWVQRVASHVDHFYVSLGPLMLRAMPIHDFIALANEARKQT